MRDEPRSPRAGAKPGSLRGELNLRLPLFAFVTMPLGGGVIPSLIVGLLGALMQDDMSIPLIVGDILSYAAVAFPVIFGVCAGPPPSYSRPVRLRGGDPGPDAPRPWRRRPFPPRGRPFSRDSWPRCSGSTVRSSPVTFIAGPGVVLVAPLVGWVVDA